MADTSFSFTDKLSQREGENCERIIAELDGVRWAQPLLTRIAKAGGVQQKNKGLLFELRFGNALHEKGIVPDYEIAGEGDSTIDFGFTHGGMAWAVELMRLEETDAVKAAIRLETDDSGREFAIMHLHTDAEDKRQSTEGETLKAVQRICQKCEKDGKPNKFPRPDERVHVIAVDFRTFLDGNDDADQIHIALGGKYLRKGYRQFWNGKLITGVFDAETTLRGSIEAQQRVHFLAFVNEQDYGPGQFGSSVQFIANPHLYNSANDVRRALDTWPLQSARALNP